MGRSTSSCTIKAQHERLGKQEACACLAEVLEKELHIRHKVVRSREPAWEPRLGAVRLPACGWAALFERVLPCMRGAAAS